MHSGKGKGLVSGVAVGSILNVWKERVFEVLHWAHWQSPVQMPGILFFTTVCHCLLVSA